MSLESILKTKLFIPELREGTISRPRLIDLINQDIEKKVAFVSAPAGFGKSTLLADWVLQTDYPVSWVSLDKSLDEPALFLSYLIAGVQNIWSDLGGPTLDVLNSSSSPSVDYLLNSWINELAEHTSEFVIVLDDFHQIKNEHVDNLLCHLIEHQPPQLHLVFSSRAEIPSCFSRLRGHANLSEINVADLRFSEAESIAFLKSQLGSKITRNDALLLNERTEGWIAGLQMAALSMRSSENISHHVAQFSANNRYVTDYLLDEILDQQSDEIEDFLLETSILNKFTAPLCDYLRQSHNSQEIIETLVRRGMFTVPLDTTNTWYRYHHLFSELMQSRLANSGRFSIVSIHKNASNWYASQGMLAESINHAFEIEDFDLVILRIETFISQIVFTGQFRSFLNWVEKLPKDLVRAKPIIEIVKIFMLHEMGKLADRDQQLAIVEELLGPIPDPAKDYSQSERINWGILAAIKTLIYASQDFLVDETYKYAEIANRFLPEEYDYWRTLAQGAIPFLQRAQGNYEQSIAAHLDLLPKAIESGFTFQAFIFYSILTKSYLESGQLRRALLTCQTAIDLDHEHETGLPFAKFLYLLMGEILYQRGEREKAESYLEKGLEHVVRHGEVFSIIDGYYTLIQIQIANSDEDQALAVLSELKQILHGMSLSSSAQKVLNAVEAHTNILLDNLIHAAKIIAQPEFDSLDDQFLFDLNSHSFVGIYRVSQTPVRIYKNFIKLTLARFHYRQNNVPEGLSIIEELLSEMSNNIGFKYELDCLILKSLLLLKMNSPAKAIAVFKEGIKLASQEGNIQLFLNEGQDMKNLLAIINESEFSDIEERIFILKLRESLQSKFAGNGNALENALVQLTPREIEVLSSLGFGASYSEAADKLSISRNTIKTHTKRIYQKLGVSGLLQALNKAKQLSIIE